MITPFRPFCRIFATEIANRSNAMAKTQRQYHAMDYAMDYLERLLKVEDMVGRSIDQRIQDAMRNYMKEQKNKDASPATGAEVDNQ